MCLIMEFLFIFILSHNLRLHFFYPSSFFKMPKITPVNSRKQLNETPRKRKSLTAAQKKEVCLKKLSTPFLKQKELANEYDVSEGMISDILKETDRWLAIDTDSHQAGLRREKKIPFPTIEEALTIWVDNALQ